MTAVISCRGATRRYPRGGRDAVVAVRDVDLEVQPGEFVAIQGPSGSGKTTLLGLLAGLEAADDGTVSVLGHDLGRLSPTERARLRRSRMGIVFQSFGLIASLTASENVALPMALGLMSRAERAMRASAALAEVGLRGSEDRRIDELSGGERQRLGVARAIAGDPTIVLADEPTGSLDDENAAVILDLLASTVGKRGASLVLVTHDPESASRADRSILMRDGALLKADT